MFADRQRRWRADLIWTTALTLLVLGPMLVRRGFALRGDMIFVPDQPWKAAWLGLDGAVPRAVPMDAVVWLLGQLVSGDLVQKSLLAGSFLVAGLGIGWLLRALPPLPRAAGIAVYLWNPWVYERLAIGQWACVLCYALLPWIVVTACRWRDEQPGGWGGTAALLVLGSVCAPSMELLAVLVASGILLARPTVRSLTGLLATAGLASLPWSVPALLRAGIEPPSHQFDAFSARAESSLGLIGSLFSLGGIWKTSVVPPERGFAVVVALSVLLAIAAFAAFVVERATLGPLTTLGVGIGAALGLTIAMGSTYFLSGLGPHFPALGMLRDSHRFLAPLALPLAIGQALLVDRLLTAASPRRDACRLVAIMVTLLPLVLLPSLSGGLRGALSPVRYPAEWSHAASLVRDTDGAVVVLPWTGSYRSFGWNGHRAMLDPAPRLLPADVLVDDQILLGDSRVAGEDPFLTRIGAAVEEASPDALRALGVRWVLVEKDNGVSEQAIPTGRVALDSAGLRLIDLGSPAAANRDVPPTAWVIAGDLIALTLLIAALVASRRVRETRHGPQRRAVVVNWRDLDHSRAGGAERYAWEVTQALTGAGFQVEFLCARDRDQARHELRDGIVIVRVGGRITFLPRALLRLARHRHRLDLVVDADCGLPAFSPLVLSQRRTAIVLVVHHVHQAQFGALPQPLAGIARGVERRMMPRVYRRTTTVAVSESTRTEMRSQLGWAGPVMVIPNGTDTPADVAVEPQGERVIVLGRLAPHKRVDLAVRALVASHRHRPALRADVVGGGPEHERLRRLVEVLGAADVVRFHGKVDEAEKHRLLASARVHLCASAAEGWGQVVLEAAGHGVPTLARDVPGLRDSVRPGVTGWLIGGHADDAATVEALTEGLRGALGELAETDRREEMAVDCRDWAGRFTWAETHRLTVAVAAEALTQRVNAR
ncbi:glycosyltransferase [Marmoricola sp. RAF53]|uniref:glycosyltransferase n=1 Tax=Marmoricola sp. RAF53 TaxID=3233059 RepID=UPI003F9D7E81